MNPDPFLSHRSTAHYQNCYNCHTTIAADNTFRTPIAKQASGQYIWDNLPFCRPECVLRHNIDAPITDNSLLYIYEYYGIDILPSPPRALLFTANGLTLQEYHQQCTQRKVIFAETQNIRHITKTAYSECIVPLKNSTESNVFTKSRSSLASIQTNSMNFLDKVPMNIS